jgi:Arc/MetJ family transcription regulator
MCNIIKEESRMATNLNIDTELLEKAYIISRLKTKRETVNLALNEFIKRHKQKGIIDLFNSVEYEADFDYKKSRKKR